MAQQVASRRHSKTHGLTRRLKQCHTGGGHAVGRPHFLTQCVLSRRTVNKLWSLAVGGPQLLTQCA